MYPIPGALYQPYMFALYRLPVDSAGNIGTPVNVDGDAGSGINVGAKAVLNAVVTPDERHLYFCSQRSGPYIIWESHRADPGAPWGQPAPLPTSINTGSNDNPVYVTPDNCTLYYSSDGSGVLTMYKVTRGF